MSQSSAELKRVVRESTETIFNDKDLNKIDEYFAESHVGHGGPGGDMESRDELRAWFEQIFTGFPDLTAKEEFSIVEDDMVASRFTYAGTHDGEFLGIPATGKQVSIKGVSFSRVEDGKIVETYPHADIVDLMAQVGVIDLPSR